MAVHRKILEWQAANPIITWMFWIVVWAIVFYLLFRPAWPQAPRRAANDGGSGLLRSDDDRGAGPAVASR